MRKDASAPHTKPTQPTLTYSSSSDTFRLMQGPTSWILPETRGLTTYIVTLLLDGQHTRYCHYHARYCLYITALDTAPALNTKPSGTYTPFPCPLPPAFFLLKSIEIFSYVRRLIFSCMTSFEKRLALLDELLFFAKPKPRPDYGSLRVASSHTWQM